MARPAPEGADPEFPVPDSIQQQRSCKPLYLSDGSGEVMEQEFQWMEARKPLRVSRESLQLDFGAHEAAEILQNFGDASLGHLLGTLNWPGVGTRWRSFLEWCQAQEDPSSLTPELALRGFGRSMGRVITYRALALDPAALQSIMDADCIFPSGQLQVGAETLAAVVDTKGIRTVCVARLFISNLRRLLGHDPSISLHDDWQTTSLIASGYARQGRKVHLFELSCPKVESVGWTLQEVAERSPEVLGDKYRNHDPWFCFPAPAYPQGLWFDGRLQRTERYGLYGVPFLSQRLQRLLYFDSSEELGRAIQPLAARLAELHEADTNSAAS